MLEFLDRLPEHCSHQLFRLSSLLTEDRALVRNPSALSNLVLYPEFKLIYNRVKKSGNSSTLMYLSDALYPNTLPEVATASFEEYLRFKDFAASQGVPVTWRSMILRRARISTNALMTVVRSPFSRLLSAFLQKRSLMQAGRGAGYRQIPGFLNEEPVPGFQEFVRHLAEVGPYQNAHWWPQLDLLITTPENFDFLIKLENFHEGFDSLLDFLGVSGFSALRTGPHPGESPEKVTSATTEVNRFYDHGTTRLVHSIYRDDFEFLGY